MNTVSIDRSVEEGETAKGGVVEEIHLGFPKSEEKRDVKDSRRYPTLSDQGF